MEEFLAALDPWLIYMLVGLLTLGESAAFLGVILPGEIGLVAAAALAATGRANWLAVAVVATLGAVLGGMVAYEVSRRHGTRLLEWRPIARHFDSDITRWAPRMTGSGAIGLVVMGRFNQVTRAVVPALAGINGMNRFRFWVANLAGGLLWAGVFTGIGYFAAEWWQASSNLIHLVAAVLVLLAAGLWLMTRYRRRSGRGADGTARAIPQGPERPDPEAPDT